MFYFWRSLVRQSNSPIKLLFFNGDMANCRAVKTYRMPKSTQQIVIAEEVVISKIYFIRGENVMLDRDLAELYGVATIILKQAVRRNISRFPTDFMFEMTEEELENWRSQFVTSKQDRQGLRYPPFCFTEQGATMLSCLLNSASAILVNILILCVNSSSGFYT